MKNMKSNVWSFATAKFQAKRRSLFAIALVTAILFGFTACNDETDPEIGIILNKNTVTLLLGVTPPPPADPDDPTPPDPSKTTLTATVINTDNKEVTWNSGKNTVATVSASGLVTAKKSGITVITATSKDGGKTATCTVTVQEVYTTKSTSKGIEMISIPAGTFIMGQTGIAGPMHLVTLTDFYIGKCEVTQEQYEAVMGSNPSNFIEPVTEEDDKLPVERVSWYDALVFCNKLSDLEGLDPVYSIDGKTSPALWTPTPTSSNSIWDAVIIVAGANGYRLPTEAQWEYACRAGTTTLFNTGDTISDNTGWYIGNSGNKTHQVGIKSANAWGLFDMHGNVLEWCWDWEGAYLTDPGSSSSGSLRMGRGGSWTDPAEFLRSAFRYSYDPYIRNHSIGLRVVRPY